MFVPSVFPSTSFGYYSVTSKEKVTLGLFATALLSSKLTHCCTEPTAEHSSFLLVLLLLSSCLSLLPMRLGHPSP